MRYPDPRDDEPLDRDAGDHSLNRGGRAGESPRDVDRSRDPRDVFTRDLSLPRGPERQHVFDRDRTYLLRGLLLTWKRLTANICALCITVQKSC